ncbi:glycoside hydrolase family 79 protein [Calocera cornea HHB12733]|uniref:Glycoside hydrolase family 79 protein n=1 Tax=Calocera cornea HHB12733 TaxID=1353952 RepID=A0A165E7X0_9BASI|nr:glycoside hydrolase family 79 protein [Calocera cornea HHB12733]
MLHLLLGALGLAQLAASQTPVTITIPPSIPSTAKYLYGSLVGMSIEQDRFPDWAGTLGSPNPYTMSVLQNIVDRYGVPPPIRVGGNTEDKTHWSGDVQYSNNTYPAVTTTTPYPEADTVLVGTDFWSLAGNFPSGTEFTFGINLKAQANYEAVIEAQIITQVFQTLYDQGSGVTLRYLELGNEPDLYAGGWTIDYYTTLWNSLATSIQGALSYPPRMQILSFANPTASNGFTVSGALNAGLLSGTLRESVYTVSEHHYQGSFCQGAGGAVAELMSKAYVRGNLSGFVPEIAAANEQGWRFELGETNSVSCHGAPGLSNAGGAAVWGVDYIFQAASLGIERLYFHNGIGYKYDFFDPYNGINDGTPYTAPHILPLYHALLIQSELTSYSGPIYIAELTTDSDFAAAYGIYAADTSALLRVVIINSAPYYTYYTPGTRAEFSYTLSGLTAANVAGNGGSGSYFLRRLYVPGADATSGLTWAQQSFETADGTPSGTRVDESVTGEAFSGVGTEVIVAYFAEG